jgi:hypothetical protein
LTPDADFFVVLSLHLSGSLIVWIALSTGGVRKGFHYNDVWNMKYLPKFKWHHLTERMGMVLDYSCSYEYS